MFLVVYERNAHVDVDAQQSVSSRMQTMIGNVLCPLDSSRTPTANLCLKSAMTLSVRQSATYPKEKKAFAELSGLY